MKIAVVGGGPAGVACASLLKRYNVDVTIYEKKSIGGLIENAWYVENFPLVEPDSGFGLVRRLRKIVDESNIDVIFDEIMYVKDNKLVGRKSVYGADVVVLATGTVPKRLVDFEVSDRVVYEYRDLPKGVKRLAVYGGGDVAFDGAIHATLDGTESTIFVRGNYLKAVPKLIEKAYELGIRVYLNSEIRCVENTIEGIQINTETGKFTFDALLIAIGREVNLPVVENTKNLYIIGDAAHLNFRQSSIAIGDGIRCAMEIIQRLKD